jgi:hypothetical protein
MKVNPINDLLERPPQYPLGRSLHMASRHLWLSEAPDDKSLMVFFDAHADLNNVDLQSPFSHIKIFHDRGRPDTRVVIKLEQSAVEEKFVYVMESIAEDLAKIDAAQHLNFILSELANWSGFLAPKRDGLGKNELVGLWGELHIFSNYLIGRLSPREAVAAYCGIHDAPQDIAQNDFSIEVKTTLQKTPSNISISSLEQLDAWPARQLLVLLMAGEDDSGDSVNALLDRISDGLQSDRGAQIAFQQTVSSKLERATEQQLQLGFAKGSEYTWEVNDSFPSLRRRQAPEGVVSASYKISIAHIVGFAVNENVGEWLDGVRTTRV